MTTIVLSYIILGGYIELPMWVRAFYCLAIGFDIATIIKKRSGK